MWADNGYELLNAPDGLFLHRQRLLPLIVLQYTIDVGDNAKYVEFKKAGRRVRGRSFVACDLCTIPLHFSNSIKHLAFLINFWQ